MPVPGFRPPRRLPESVRRRLEVAAAMAWEAIADAHTAHALQFVELTRDQFDFDEALDRYLREMHVPAAMAVTVRTRALVALEEAERQAVARGPRLAEEEHAEPLAAAGAAEPRGAAEGWRRFRPDVVVREVKERQRRNEETERLLLLAIARAEEGLIRVHIRNALAFVDILDPHFPLDRAVEEYIDAMGLLGARSQVVFQRTMARLAEKHLPPPPHPAARGEPPGAGLRRPRGPTRS